MTESPEWPAVGPVQLTQGLWQHQPAVSFRWALCMELWVDVSQTGRAVVITMRGMQWSITKTKSRQDASQAGVVTDRAVLSSVRT